MLLLVELLLLLVELLALVLEPAAILIVLRVLLILVHLATLIVEPLAIAVLLALLVGDLALLIGEPLRLLALAALALLEIAAHLLLAVAARVPLVLALARAALGVRAALRIEPAELVRLGRLANVRDAIALEPILRRTGDPHVVAVVVVAIDRHARVEVACGDRGCSGDRDRP